MDKMLGQTIDSLAAIYELIRGKPPTTLHCHPATMAVLKHELTPDTPNMQAMHLIHFHGLRVVVDYKLSPGTLFVDGD